MAIEHERARAQYVEVAARHETIVQAQPVERERQRVTFSEHETERLRAMGRAAILQESAQAAVAQQQANAILHEERAAVASLQQLAQARIHAVEMQTAIAQQQATTVLHERRAVVASLQQSEPRSPGRPEKDRRKHVILLTCLESISV
jgi:hypothetical protein